MQQVSIPAKKIFKKVPGRKNVTGVFFPHCNKQGVGISSKDALFFRHRKSDIELARAKVLDRSFVTGFLCTELITGKTEHG